MLAITLGLDRLSHCNVASLFHHQIDEPVHVLSRVARRFTFRKLFDQLDDFCLFVSAIADICMHGIVITHASCLPIAVHEIPTAIAGSVSWVFIDLTMEMSGGGDLQLPRSDNWRSRYAPVDHRIARVVAVSVHVNNELAAARAPYLDFGRSVSAPIADHRNIAGDTNWNSVECPHSPVVGQPHLDMHGRALRIDRDCCRDRSTGYSSAKDLDIRSNRRADGASGTMSLASVIGM